MMTKIVFGNEKLEALFRKLKDSKTEDKRLYKWLEKAFEELERDAFCGTQIAKRLVPKAYEERFGKMDNLWKYDLPDAWRLIYTIKGGNVVILCIVLEWLDHKSYERRFSY